MSWRSVVIANRCKLSYKNNYLIIRNEENNMIHLSEIGTIIIDSTLVSITTYLLAELVKRKTKVVFCDEKRNPISELVPMYGSHNTSKRVLNQVNWDSNIKDIVWSKIVENKINNQANLLEKYNKLEADMLYGYAKEVKPGDISNREGHAAKVYFNSLFGKEFVRHTGEDINAALDYGYAILASSINKEVASNGCITQLGIKHRNEFNFFNLSYDIIEPFRTLVDNIVAENIENEFNKDYRYKLINVLNSKLKMEGKSYYFTNAVQIYVKGLLNALDEGEPDLVPYINIDEL
ncbi:type II CRISPR-associated endonuclease Cas1 [Tissierella praeacuta]|uniref:type II CRISPR-associated endonuclease Cas1 n=1 Tax=Tissierella praeacuta TaxID=43131 RepID=UPI0028B1B526|nr:type II CRISPR-associated endonuclease Cas1 [Tissierella praeacuta]